MIEIIQTNILDNTDNKHLLTLKTTNFYNFMERVTWENIDLFYKGSIIFRIDPLNGNELGYKYITNDNNDIIVREYNVLIDSERCGKITSRQELEIIKDHYYFYTNEVDVIDTKIEWLKNEIKRYTQLLVRNEELQKENRELRRQLENKEHSKTNPEPLLPDYEEVQSDGRVWYKRTHFNAQRKESRQVEKYDVIITKRDLDEPVPYILFVDSFDFESDFAARCFYGKSVYYKDYERQKYSETWYGNFAPGFKYFSFATHEEIKELFDKINESPSLYEYCITNKEIKERYSEYLN